MTLARRARAAESPRRPPNVLLVLTDDQGWGDIHSHGNAQLDTPVLDRLAADGARFDRFYVAPLCAPTRASLLTGRYHPRTGVSGVCAGQEVMRAEEVTIAQVLKAAGYATGCFGKWHNGEHYPYHPLGKGFDEFFGFCGGNWLNYFDTTLEHQGQPVPTRGYITDVLTDAALRFVEKRRDRPWFCYVPYNAPHGPFQVPDKYFDKYAARGLDPKTASVYGMVENVDANVGRLLGKLDDLGQADRTIVVFLTDNGPNGNRFNGAMRGIKGSADEGGCRVPCFVRWPARIRPGTVIAPIAAHVDLVPTLAEAAGVKDPRTLPLDGVSLLALLEGRGEGWPDRMIFEPKGAVRTQRWRLQTRGKGGRLYDMAADPGQTKDVAGEHRDVAARLAAAFAAWQPEAFQGLAGMPPPIPVGHAEAPIVDLTAHRASVRGVQRNTPWTCSYLKNWTNVQGQAEWDVEVVRAGRYDVALLATCPESAVGTRLRVEADGAAVEGSLAKAHDPPPVPAPDRVKRGEPCEKAWAPMPLGTLALENKRMRLRLRAGRVPGEQGFDLQAVRLARLD